MEVSFNHLETNYHKMHFFFLNSCSIFTLNAQNTESNVTSRLYTKDTEVDFAIQTSFNLTNQIMATFSSIVPGIKSLKITVCLL